MRKLTDICDIQYGYAFDSKYFTEDSSYPELVRIRDVKRGYSETFYSGEFPKEYILSAGDLLIGMDGEFNIARWKSDGALLNQRVCKLSAKEGINEEYLRFAMSKELKRIEQRTAFVTVKHLSAKELNKLELDVPNIFEQNRIADTLKLLEEIIKKRQQELQKLNDLIRARFVEMFGELASNPCGWDTFTMEECFDITSSKRILKSEWKSQGIPFLRVRDMVQLATTGQMDNEYFVSEEFYESLSDSDGVPRKGDILVSATSTLGKCHVVSEGERYYFKDADVLRFRAKKEINPIFFMELMKTYYVEDQISKTLGITTVAHFTIKAAKTINMRCPAIELQDEFADFVKQVNKSKAVIQKALDKTQLLFDSLMQKYFG